MAFLLLVFGLSLFSVAMIVAFKWQTLQRIFG